MRLCSSATPHAAVDVVAADAVIYLSWFGARYPIRITRRSQHWYVFLMPLTNRFSGTIGTITLSPNLAQFRRRLSRRCGCFRFVCSVTYKSLAKTYTCTYVREGNRIWLFQWITRLWSVASRLCRCRCRSRCPSKWVTAAAALCLLGLVQCWRFNCFYYDLIWRSRV